VAATEERQKAGEAHDFITRAVGKAVEGIAARLDALGGQPAAIARAQARGTAKPDAGYPAGEGGAREREPR